MDEFISKYECTGCAACASACPQKCITMLPDKMGFLYPKVDSDRCIKCGLCKTRCPVCSKTVVEEVAYIPEAYAVMGNEDEIRKNSSSGGVFGLLAKHILSQGGVVLGAAFDDTCHSVQHIAVDSQNDLKKLQGSKYLQSEIGNSYMLARSLLECGRLVLFTGTPCQISGLKSFLHKDYSNLYLQEIVCHGVPSPAVWHDYLTVLEKRFEGNAKCVSFRDKTNDWEKYLLRVEFDNGSVYSNDRVNDLYMRGFLHDCFLRQSCYRCAHKGIERVGDITLADFWGIKNICPEMFDGKGTSLVIVSSPKGKTFLEQICTEVRMQKVVLSDVIPYNSALVKSAGENPNRENFEKEFRQKPTLEVLKKYCSMSKYAMLKKAIKSLLEYDV